MSTPHDEPTNAKQDPGAADADAADAVRAFREQRARSSARATGELDQLLAHADELVRSADRVSAMNLPPGQRIELVRTASRLLRCAIFGLEHEWDALPAPASDAHDEALELLGGLQTFALQRRLENRIRLLAFELAPDDADEEAYAEVALAPRVSELVAAAGWAPSDELLRTWIEGQVARQRV